MRKLINSYAVLFILLIGIQSESMSQTKTLGIFENHTDVGIVKKAGTVDYNAETEEYRIGGSGTNMWSAHDDFHFVWKKMTGNFILNTKIAFVGKGVDPHRKAGWMVRHSLEPNTPYADAVVHGDGLTALQFRKEVGGQTEEVKTEINAPDYVQLERRKNKLIMSVAKEGEPLTEIGVVEINLGDEVYVGLVVCAHNADVFEEAVFSNVRISIPAKEGFVPYSDFSGSRLEILDIETGLRKVVYTTKESIEAPNWTRDGKALIYNSKGSLYKFPLDTRKPEKLNTGFADENNNDHVISFDGKRMAISHHGNKLTGDKESTIYVLPIEGGTPKQVTDKSPSYLHGWSPDGKYLVYTARRNDDYDIYKISVKGGKEIQLTNTKGLDDGPEYTADGKYIYINSTRTGTMQIWRMKPNGSKQEQLTFDEYNDWFAHPSPDGKWALFISYSKEIEAGNHPPYKHVMLRMMPLNGGKPKVLAYLYGGQGTINVPSWSPDSKKVAFVSYTF